MYCKMDIEGRHHQLIHKIVNRKKDKISIKKSYGLTRSGNGNRVPKNKTQGWKIMVKCKYRLSYWIYLVELKVSNIIELVE